VRWFNGTMPDEIGDRLPGEPSRPRQPRRPRRLVALPVAIAAAVAVGGWALLAGRSSTARPTAPTFVEETATAGIEHRYEGGFPFFVGGGIAVLDCDADERPDLYVAGGAAPAGLHRNTSVDGGALRFEPVPSPVTDVTSVTGAYPLDVDSDRQLDLVVLRNGERNLLLRGLGDCRFEDASDRFGLPTDAGWTVAFSATWEDDDVLPTLAFGNYLVPGTFDCDTNALVRPEPDGSRYATPIPLPGSCTLSVLFSDWSGSGRRDLRVANDRHYYRTGGEQLWRIEPGRPPRLYDEGDGWRPLQVWGMGLASQDLTGDGLPEVFITSQGDNKLQTLDDATEPPDVRPAYRDIALELGVTAHRPYTGDDILPSTAWHPEFDDVDNDGLPDLLITKGNVDAQIESAVRDPSNLLMGRPDGTFEESAERAGIVSFDRARGAALTDLNLDGMLDLVVVNRMANVRVWRNVGTGGASAPEPMGHWLDLRLQQPAPNVDAIGALIEVEFGDTTVYRELVVGGGHAGGESGRLHVGLGTATRARVRVRWPDGAIGDWIAVDADRYVVVERD
jgi:hypothetical protein